MTIGYGLGMLAMGMIAIAVAGTIIFKIINYKPKKEKYGE